VSGHFDIELFMQHERDAAEKAASLRARGLTVEMQELSGGYGLAISGPAAAMEELYREIAAERQAQQGRAVTGTVRWWKDEKGSGRITGDDGYIYFCHFSALQVEGTRRCARASVSSSSASRAWPTTAVQEQRTCG
jgi:hypothetical protein